MSVAINAGERPRAAAFGSETRPFLESANGLRPLPAAAAFGRFQGRSLFEVKQEKNGRACQRWDSRFIPCSFTWRIDSSEILHSRNISSTALHSSTEYLGKITHLQISQVKRLWGQVWT